MFKKLLELLRQVIGKMFPKQNMSDALGIDIPVSEDMSVAIDLWQEIYLDKAPWVDNKIVYSLNLGAAIASEVARLTTIEMQSEITPIQEAPVASGEASKAPDKGMPVQTGTPLDALNKDYQKVIDSLKIQTEYTAAKGGMVFKPYLDSQRVVVDFVQADQFFPTSYNSNGDITSVIFTERKYIGDSVFTRLEHHQLLNNIYTITNKAFVAKKDDDKLGAEVSLTAVDEWKDLAESASFTGIDRPLYAYFRMPLANRIDTTSPLGVSIFAGAVDLLKQADKQYSRTLWEYEAGEMAIDATQDMFKTDGSLPEGKDRLYRKLDVDETKNGQAFYNVFNPDLRDDNYWVGLNKILQRIEFNCGLAYGTLSDMQVVSKTAEEIKSSKQRSYSTVSDMQKNLQTALEQLVWAMRAWQIIGENIGKSDVKSLVVPEDYDISFGWDDSIVVDADKKRATRMAEVAASLISGDFYLKDIYGVTDEQIKEMRATTEIEEPEPEDKDLE